MTSFIKTFTSLSPDVAAILPWWHWLALFFEPIVAMLAVLVAFLDRSIQVANEKREAAEKNRKGEPMKTRLLVILAIAATCRGCVYTSYEQHGRR